MSGFRRRALWMGLALIGTLGLSSPSHAAFLSEVEWTVTGGTLSSSDQLNGSISSGTVRFTVTNPLAVSTPGTVTGILSLTLTPSTGYNGFIIKSLPVSGYFGLPSVARAQAQATVGSTYSASASVQSGTFPGVRPIRIGGNGGNLISYGGTQSVNQNGVAGSFAIEYSGAQALGLGTTSPCSGTDACTFAHTFTIGNEVRTTVTSTTTTTTFPTTTSSTTTTTTTTFPVETTTTTTAPTTTSTTSTTTTTTTTSTTTTTTTSTTTTTAPTTTSTTTSTAPTTTTTTVPPSPKVTICHRGEKTLRVSRSALDAHLRHGDQFGVCPL